MKPRVEFDLSILENNIKDLKQQTNNINYLFPVKCCNHPKVLKIINNNGFGFDISNINEFKIIEKYLVNQFVSVSSPLSYQLSNCKYQNLHIVANNLGSFSDNKGIRINLNSNKLFDNSRFGEDYKTLNKDFRNRISYIHLHNSDHKTLEKCDEIYNEIRNIIKTFPNLKIINIGGHLEDLSFDEGITYLNRIREIIPNNINIYAELGDFLFKNVGTLYANVVDVRYDDKKQIVTLNFSKMANKRWAYPIYYSESSTELLFDTVFYGCSCCETDMYLETKTKKLFIGDKVIFKNISPYSYQWDITFNGIDKMNYIFK